MRLRPPTPLWPDRAAPSAGRSRAGRRLACLTAVTALVALASGCGSSGSSGTNADPAGATPAGAPVYVGATVRPSGSQKDEAKAFGQALSGQSDPYLRLTTLLQTPGSPQLDFEHDVAPWLGPHAGVFVSSLSFSDKLVAPLVQSLLHGSTPSAYPFGAHGAQGALVLDTSDSGKAQSFLSSQAGHADAHQASYKGVSYEVTAEGLAFAIVAHFAVVGSESALHEVIDTASGSASLLHASSYSKLLASAPANALAHVYIDPTAAGAGASAQGGDPLQALAGAQPANVSLVTSATAATLDLDSLTSSSSASTGGLLSADPQAATAFGELPGESWLAIGLGHVGTSLGKDAAGLQSLGSLTGLLSGSTAGSAGTGEQGLGPLVSAMTAPLKVMGADSAQAKHDFTSWMGSGGIFAAGASLFELKAGVVIESTDAAASKAAVGKLAAALAKDGGSTTPAAIPGADAAVGVRLPGLPLVLDIASGTSAAGNTKFVLGLGEMSVQTALTPSSTMSASATRQTAAATLGEGIQPSIAVDFPTLVGLLEAIGFTDSPELAPAVPYLRATTTLYGGGRPASGQVERFRLVLDVHHASG
jgi:hypothetical protein